MSGDRLPKILARWVERSPEAILCQRDLQLDINFTPAWILSAHDSIVEFLIEETNQSLKSLQNSKNYFQTASLVVHRKPTVLADKNKGILIVGYIVHWKKAPEMAIAAVENPTIIQKGGQAYMITMNCQKAHFWSGVRFGSYNWEEIPRNLPKLQKRRSFFPKFRHGRRISQKEEKILAKSHFLHVGTVTPAGTIHVTPVHMTHVRNRVLFATSLHSTKFRSFRSSQVFTGYTYSFRGEKSDFGNALTIRGTAFAYGWNLPTTIFYGLLFSPYLAYVAYRMWKKHPLMMRNFPMKTTNIRWRFMPFVARTFIEIYWTG